MKEIKEINIYECTDGTRFDIIEDAEKYQLLCNNLKEAEIYLNDRTKQCENGIEYVQQSKEQVERYRKRIFNLAAEYIPSFSKTFIECGNGTRHISHAERIISDYNNQALNRAVFRLSCTSSDTFREYQQPYYAYHEGQWPNKI